MDLNDNIIFEFRNDYYFLSNFYPCIIILNILIDDKYSSIKFTSAEMAYQYGKAYFAKDNNQAKNILKTLSPKDSKYAGRLVKFKTDSEFNTWENYKFKWMYKVIESKFIQNIDLQIKLVSTYPKFLIEGNNWNDEYWGYSLDKQTGFNNLGIILMIIRNQIINNYNTDIINSNI